jgi:hypothetical protein
MKNITQRIESNVLQAKNIRKIFLGLVLAACSLQLAACGYSTKAGNMPAGIKTIYVMPFTNKIDITNEVTTLEKYRSYRPLLEVDITKKTIDRFNLDGSLKIGKRDSQDWLLKGELVEYRRDPLKYSDIDDETVTEYRINLIVNLFLYDRDNKLLWSEQRFTGQTDYYTQGAYAKSESTAIDDAVTDLSRRIVERVVENW